MAKTSSRRDTSVRTKIEPPPHRRDGPGRLGAPILAQIDHRDVIAAFGERQRRRPADAPGPAGAGDDRNAIG